MTPMAFYAPLKAPTHPNPSGDRTLARALIQALEIAGFRPDLASDLRLIDRTGNAVTQTELQSKADAVIPEIIAQGHKKNWAFWLTYHNYYKAPDLIGPRVADALNIPYVQIESTRARKRLEGPWADFAVAAERAAERADLIFYFTKRDAEALSAYAPAGQKLVHLRPFLPRTDLPPHSTRTGPMLSAAMMRPGDKLASFELIAQTLAMLDTPWQLNIAGDGAARSDVAALMAQFGDRVQFLGELNATGMAQAYANARLLFWPGVNEAIGLTYLEAQAVGIPVLAQDRPGLRDVLAPTPSYPSPEAGPMALAAQLKHMLEHPIDPHPIQDHIRKHHLLPAAAQTLRIALEDLL
ncbi:MAG: glycosyltransferase [Aliishimia sp.]